MRARLGERHDERTPGRVSPQVGHGFGWPPPAVATLTRAVPGAAVSLASTTSGEVESSTTTVSGYWQVTVDATMPHDQPGPPALTGVIPSGRGSVTTIGAVVSLGPWFVTMTGRWRCRRSGR